MLCSFSKNRVFYVLLCLELAGALVFLNYSVWFGFGDSITYLKVAVTLASGITEHTAVPRFSVTGAQTRGLVHVRHAIYQLSYLINMRKFHVAHSG